MRVSYNDGRCTLEYDTKSLELTETGVLLVTSLDMGGVHSDINITLPDWLAVAIQREFKNKVETEINRGV